MLEGKKISELEPTTKLQRSCCFPVLNNGVTRRITYASLLSEIENDLPESEIEQVKDDLEKLQSRAKTSEKRIDDLETETENLKSEFDVVDEMVQGQNATIRNYTTTVEEIERTIENTHFDDVLELEQQVRTNEANIQRNASAIENGIAELEAEIETKQNSLSSEQLAAVNSGITAEKVAQYDRIQNPIDDDTTDTTHGWSGAKIAEEIEQSEVYSDEEIVIGKWFGKTLYQKTMLFENKQFPYQTFTTVFDLPENCNLLLWDEVLITSDEYYFKSFAYGMRKHSNNRTVIAYQNYTGGSTAVKSYYIVAKYTKTTD